MDTAVVQQSVK